MANSYTQLHIHFVFAVKYRRAMIHPEWKDDLHKYITGIFQQNNHKMMQINNVPDHIHILVGLRPHQAISQIIQNVKTESSKWINANGFCRQKFAWQGGYGAFACSRDHAYNVVRYIANQEEHHRREKFADEYRRLLEENEVEYDERYLFTEPVDR